MTRNFFVYGTLRSGEQRAYVMKDSVRYIGKGVVQGHLFNIHGAFPALVPVILTPYSTQDKSSLHLAEVVGEVYETDDPEALLKRLDLIEGTVWGLYDRFEISVTLDDGSQLVANTYVAGDKLAGELIPDNQITSGDWMDWRKGDHG